MTYRTALHDLKQLWKEATFFRSNEMLLMWDQWTGLPQGGSEYRQQLQGFMAGQAARLWQSKRARDLADFFAGYNLSSIESDIDRAVVRSFLFKYSRTVNVPAETLQRLAALSAQSQRAWMKAVGEKDYSIFKPHLKEIFEIKKEIAQIVDPTRPPLEVLMSESDEDISLDEVQQEFEKVRRAVSQLLQRIQHSEELVDDTCINQEFDKDDLLEFVKHLTTNIGYDKTNGAYGLAPHPFTCPIGPKDARITTNVSSYRFGVLSSLHEAGHAIYGYGGSSETDDADLWGGLSGSFHEAQSRFYENSIGRSKAFWKRNFPEAQRRFSQFKDVSFKQYYAALNKVAPSLKRVTADEVSYSLHPIIRFELEQELFDGTIDFDCLPEAWNDKYENYLGVVPQDDAEGLLQDIHWSVGMFGYFQSYTLGNIYCGQVRAALLKGVPHAFEEVERGNMEPVNNWLRENIYRHGSCYTGKEIMKRLSGEGLNADYFIDYLTEKYTEIYGL